MNASIQERSRSASAKQLLALLATACSLATSAYAQVPAPPILLEPGSPTGGIPIQGGNAGQAGATGWQHTGVTLRNCESYVSGPDYVLDGRGSPLTVDSCDFLGRAVRIYGQVTLKRSRIRDDTSSDCASPAISIQKGAGPVLIEDVEIATTNVNAVGGAKRQDRTICVFKGNSQPVTLRRVWSHDTMRGLDITSQSNILVEDSYLGPNVSPPIGHPPGGSGCAGSERAHASAVRAAGGTHAIIFRNSVLHLGACAWGSGLIATYPENGANYDWEVDGGRWIIGGQNDGAYGIALGYTPPEEQPNRDFNIHDLEISTQSYSSGCPSGCAQNFSKVQGSKSWTNVRKYNPGKPDHGQLMNP